MDKITKLQLSYTGYILAKMDGVVFTPQREEYFQLIKKLLVALGKW